MPAIYSGRRRALVATAAIGVGLYFWYARRRHAQLCGETPSEALDRRRAERVRVHMQQHLENMMIEFKRVHGDGVSFEEFMRARFPENAKVVDSRVQIDSRVQNESWSGAFARVLRVEGARVVGLCQLADAFALAAASSGHRQAVATARLAAAHAGDEPRAPASPLTSSGAENTDART